MAEQGLFIERMDGKLVNVSLLQTIYINPEDATNLIWYFINGEIYKEYLSTEQEAQNRYKDIKTILLGSSVADLEERIREQQQTITDLNNEVSELNEDISDATETTIEINGEDVSQ